MSWFSLCEEVSLWIISAYVWTDFVLRDRL